MIFTKIFHKILKQDLTLQIMNQNVIPLRDHCLKEKIKKLIESMKDELDGKIMTKFVGLEKLQLMMTVIDDGS